MSENLVESIEFRATSRKGSLPGLDEALAKLRALDMQLDAINGKLAGIGTMSAFKRTKAEMEEVLKSSVFAKVKRGPVMDVAQALGVPDIKDFQQFVARWKASHKELAKTVFAAGATRTGQLEFASPGKAAEIARKYFTSALGQTKDQVAQLQSLFGAGTGPAKAGTPYSGTATVAGTIPLIIPASQIVASVGPGTIPVVSGGSIGSQSRSTSGRGGTFTPSGSSGKTLEEKITDSTKGRFVQTKELLGTGETVDKFFRDVNGALEPLKEVRTSSALKKAREKLQAQVMAIKADVSSSDERRNPELHRKAADMMESFVTGKSGKELQALGLGNLVMRTRASASGLRARADDMDQTGMVRDAQKLFRIREELAKARAKGDREEEARLNSERRQFEKRVRDNNRMVASKARSDEKAQKEAQKVTDHTANAANAVARRQMSHAGAELSLADFLGRGGRITSERTGTSIGPKGPETVRIVQAMRDMGTHRETLTATFDSAGASVTRLSKALSESRAEAGYLGSDFIKNTAKVTAWAASVAVLYKTVELARHSLQSLVEIGPQIGRLEQVFKGVGGSAHDLASDLLEIAAVNGQSSKEAMEAGIQWARLGLTRTQVNEAVRVSTQAANVAQIGTLEATEKLQAMMQSYGLRVGELRGTLGELVQISNIYNVTNADMLEGLTRTSAVAKQAGLPLVELMGLLGATIGATGQSGSNIGNAVKSITLALSNPILQKSLRQQFSFEATAGGEEIKSMSGILADLYVKYQHLNDAQRQSLLFQVAGRTQASRMAAMLDNYVKAQTLAVSAQLSLNTAELENAKIKASLANQLKGLTAEWERFVLIQGNRGPVQAMTGIATALRNVITLMNTPGANMAVTGILGLLAASGAKSVVTGLRLAGGGGFLSRSGTAVRQSMGTLNTTMLATLAATMGGGLATNVGTRRPEIVGGNVAGLAGGVYATSEALLRVGRSGAVASGTIRALATATGAATRALGVGLIALRGWLAPLAIITVATYGFNRAMEGIGLSSEKADAKLAGFNEEAEKAKAAANAYAEAAQLMSTVERALHGEKGFMGMRPEDQKRMLEQLSEATNLSEPDLGKRERLQGEFRKEMEAMRAQGDTAGILNRLEEERTRLIQARRGELQKEFVAIRSQQLTLNNEVNRLRGKQDGLFGQFGYEKRSREITAKEKQLQELGGDKVRNIVEQNNAFEQQLQYEQKHQSALKAEKELLETIAEIYNSMGGDNPSERAGLKQASLEAQNEAIQRQIELLGKQDEADLAGQANRESAMAKLKEQEQTLRAELDATKKISPLKYIAAQIAGRNWEPQIPPEVAQRRAELEAQIENNAREQAASTAGRTPAGELGFASRGAQRAEFREQLRQNQIEMEALRRNQPMIEAQTRFGFGREQADRSVNAGDFGIDQAQKLLNRRSEVQRQLNELEKKPNVTMEDRGRMLELEHLQYQNMLSLRERAYTVERDINQLIAERDREFRRSIFGSGPGELLRKLGAFRAAFDSSGHLQNVSAGAMLAMSPEMRRDVVGAQSMGATRTGQIPSGMSFDPEMMELFRERERLKGSGLPLGNAGAMDKIQLQLSNTLSAIAGTVKDLLPKPELEAGRAAMSQFNSAVSLAASAIMGELVPAIRSVVAVAVTASGPKIPLTGQHGGKGGGVGYMKLAPAGP